MDRYSIDFIYVSYKLQIFVFNIYFEFVWIIQDIWFKYLSTVNLSNLTKEIFLSKPCGHFIKFSFTKKLKLIT